MSVHVKRPFAIAVAIVACIMLFQNCGGPFESQTLPSKTNSQSDTIEYEAPPTPPPTDISNPTPPTPEPVVTPAPPTPIVTEPPPPNNETPTPPAELSRMAFPGAEGFGRFATGGRGGRVIYVTNTNDSGPGSLRWALEEVTEPRVVLFAVGGVLRARTQIRIRSGNVTVAGQTAPGNGFVITGARIHVAASNVILRGLKVRPGDDPSGDAGSERDAISLGYDGRIVENVIVDRNSLTWSVDETFTTWYQSRKVTFSNNIIAEPLNNSIHIDEGATSPAPHPMCMLLGQSSSEITVAKNLFANCGYRSPYSRADKLEFINNFVYNYGPEATVLNGVSGVRSHVINNHYVAGVNSVNRAPIYITDSFSQALNFISGNISDPFRLNSSIPESSLLRGPGVINIANAPVFTNSGLSVFSVEEIQNHLRTHVGARKLGALDSVDLRIIEQSFSRTGRRIDSPSDVGGLPTYPQGQAPIDTDSDGIPDADEGLFRGNPLRADSQLDKDGNGYLDLEDYLNSLFTPSEN